MHEGRTFPFGVSWDTQWQAYNFSLCAPHARQVKLLFFTETEVTQPCALYNLDYHRHKSGDIWHCLLKKESLNGALYYAYSVAGPADAFHGGWHAYDPDKLLLDPYARNVYFPPGFEREAAIGAGSNIGRAALARLIADEEPFDWTGDVAPRHDGDLVIYELHVRGFTRHVSSQVAAAHHGTFAGLIEKVPYLRELGITAVELMPVFQFEPGAGDYWGYMPLNFFAPHHLYGSVAGVDHQHNEFKQMVKALHQAGIEVILDVVYNHTAEGNEQGPTYSFKGIDNEVYYLPAHDSPGDYGNYSGTGNSLRCANRYVRQLILDSMRFWVTQMHVDGFRFDLASVLVRNEEGQIDGMHPPLLAEIRADPVLGQVRLIAEPWDAQGGYLLGRRLFPGTQWAQWNDRFRDEVRRFVRGDQGLVAAMQYRLYGSDDLFPPGPEFACHPYQSINFVNSHDGFTLYDLLAYDGKHNDANGHANTDGPNENYSWNCGWEGDQDLPAEVRQLRIRQAKNFSCLLMLSNGTPMFRAGDEFLQTQGGNNNAYNQDNSTSWLDWSRLEQFAGFHRFFQEMIAFRRRHPSISRSRFWGDDVRWYGTGRVLDQSFESHSLAYCLHGASQGDDDLYVMINMWHEPVDFQIQEGDPGDWRLAIDTARDEPEDLWPVDTDAPVVAQANQRVGGRSIVVLTRPRHHIRPHDLER
ncbi:MAG: glycogen debranching protein [Planctomycetales bacterium]